MGVALGRDDRVFAAAAALLAAFALWEQGRREPLVPFSIFRLQTLTAANVAELVIMTHTARHHRLVEALTSIGALPITRKINTVIRVGR